MAIEKYEVFFEKYGNGKKHMSIDDTSLKKYKESLPDDIYSLLEEEGISSYMDNFLWTLNPDDYIKWLNDWVQLDVKCIPFARTALGDVLFFKDNIISVLNSNKGIISYVIHRGDWFFNKYLSNDEYLNKKFNKHLYNQLENTKILKSDECFGFEPILSLGGDEKSENLKKVKLQEYLYLLSQVDGDLVIEY